MQCPADTFHRSNRRTHCRAGLQRLRGLPK
jgi:hypothetical protein